MTKVIVLYVLNVDVNVEVMDATFAVDSGAVVALIVVDMQAGMPASPHVAVGVSGVVLATVVEGIPPVHGTVVIIVTDEQLSQVAVTIVVVVKLVVTPGVVCVTAPMTVLVVLLEHSGIPATPQVADWVSPLPGTVCAHGIEVTTV